MRFSQFIAMFGLFRIAVVNFKVKGGTEKNKTKQKTNKGTIKV